MPTIEQTLAAADAARGAPEIGAVQFKPQAVQDLSHEIAGGLNQARFNARFAGQTHAVLEDLKTPLNGQTFGINDVEQARSWLQRIAQSPLRDSIRKPLRARPARSTVTCRTSRNRT